MSRDSCVRDLIGRRGAFLLLFAVVYGGIGVAYLSFPLPAPTRGSLRMVLAVAPIAVWGWVWIASAAVAVICAFGDSPRKDRWGFGAMSVMSAVWSANYVYAGITSAGGLTFARGAVGALLYGALSGAITICAGWDEPQRRVGL